MNSQIGSRLASVKADIKRMEAKYRRTPGGVCLVAVSKTMSAGDVLEAKLCGQREFGESYIQEAVKKITALEDKELHWHFIGPVQKNKTKLVAQHFDWVHSVDRLIIAERLSAQRPAALEPLQACIQVNVDHEASKSGTSVDEVPELARALQGRPQIRLRGLMAIPQADNDIGRQRQRFAQLRKLLEHLNQFGLNLDTLSMGMSGDLEAAIAEGATIVRVGTAIFGKRTS